MFNAKLSKLLSYPVGSPFARELLYGMAATTFVTAWSPFMMSTSLTHPCRQATFGWREACVDHHGLVSGITRGVDLAASAFNLAGFAAGGFISAVASRKSASVETRAFSGAMKAGFLSALMSFVYLSMHGSHLALVSGE